MTTLTTDAAPVSAIKTSKVFNAIIGRLFLPTLAERFHSSETLPTRGSRPHLENETLSPLDILARTQGVETPTDTEALRGSLEGIIDDKFIEAIYEHRRSQMMGAR